MAGAAASWIAAAPIAAFSFGDGATIGITLAGGACGFARMAGPTRLRLDRRDLDEPALPRAGIAFGSLFLVPGLGETLRINGQVTEAGLDTAFADLSAKVKPQVVFVFFLAGHGKSVEGRYYFIPQDFRFDGEDAITRRGIDQDRWQDWAA